MVVEYVFDERPPIIQTGPFGVLHLALIAYRLDQNDDSTRRGVGAVDR